MNILVSACLLGVNCKYNGNNSISEDIIKLREKHNLIPICPEQLGGLSTPRPQAEITYEDKTLKVKSINCDNVTNEYIKGAKESLKIAKIYDCETAILKARSPSCGSLKIYDGTFTSRLIDGKGITAKLFIENNIKVYNEFNFKNFLL